MTMAFFANIHAPAAMLPELGVWAETNFTGALAEAREVRGIEIHEATQSASDPLTDDGPGPQLLLQIDFSELADLETWLARPAAREALAACPALGLRCCRLDCEAFQVFAYPVAGAVAPVPRTAPLSFVVRYARPAEDEAAFRDFYLANHPPILGRLPGIRNVLCYSPLEWSNTSGIEASDCMLGNEVVFDSIEDLNAALQSPVRHELREDFTRFPPFSGAVTHHAMRRRRLWPRA